MLEQARQQLSDAGFSKVDYVALVDAATLEPIDAPRRPDAADCGGDDRLDPADRQSSARLNLVFRR